MNHQDHIVELESDLSLLRARHAHESAIRDLVEKELRGEVATLKADLHRSEALLGHHARELAARDVEVATLTAALHQRCAHPAFEYETTRTARKSGDSLKPDGEGWEPNPHITGNGRNWERFDFHESEYWMRPISASQKEQAGGE